MMTLKSVSVTNTSSIKVKLPDGSIPLEIINQGGQLYLWYLDSGFTGEETFNFQLAKLGDKVATDPANWMGHVKIGSYKMVFKIG